MSHDTGAIHTHVMAGVPKGRSRQRGSIDTLPSGSLRVRVSAGPDALTGKPHYLVEISPVQDGKPAPRKSGPQTPLTSLQFRDEIADPGGSRRVRPHLLLPPIP